MGIELIPWALRQKFHIEERLHAAAILQKDFPDELRDILGCLDGFVLKKSEVLVGGGNKTSMSKWIDSYLNARGWGERSFDTAVVVDGTPKETPTHRIDNFKNWYVFTVDGERAQSYGNSGETRSARMPSGA